MAETINSQTSPQAGGKHQTGGNSVDGRNGHGLPSPSLTPDADSARVAHDIARKHIERILQEKITAEGILQVNSESSYEEKVESLWQLGYILHPKLCTQDRAQKAFDGKQILGRLVDVC